MDFNIFVTILGYVLAPISGVVSWFACKRTRDNSTLTTLQQTIDLLVAKNTELVEKLIEQNGIIIELKKSIGALTQENITLKEGQTKMLQELTEVRKENKELKMLFKKRETNS